MIPFHRTLSLLPPHKIQSADDPWRSVVYGRGDDRKMILERAYHHPWASSRLTMTTSANDPFYDLFTISILTLEFVIKNEKNCISTHMSVYDCEDQNSPIKPQGCLYNRLKGTTGLQVNHTSRDWDWRRRTTDKAKGLQCAIYDYVYGNGCIMLVDSNRFFPRAQGPAIKDCL